jgi:hypothetical protein
MYDILEVFNSTWGNDFPHTGKRSSATGNTAGFKVSPHMSSRSTRCFPAITVSRDEGRRSSSRAEPPKGKMMCANPSCGTKKAKSEPRGQKFNVKTEMLCGMFT